MLKGLLDVSGLLDAWCCLKDNNNKHLRLLGVSGAGLNAVALLREDVESSGALFC
jgi:hypothetical protein